MSSNQQNNTIVRPDAHTQRYDRQLRLWASSGQTSLETSQILMIGSSHLSAQILKNLVLPGIGRFIIVDDPNVKQEDLGNNFFLEKNSLGKSRAVEVARLVGELNDGVKGLGTKLSPASLLSPTSSESDLISSSSLIISVNQSPEFNSSLSEYCWNGGLNSSSDSELEKKSKSKPLMLVRGSGLVGEVRVSIREAGIIDTHPDSLTSLRLKTPFPTLSSYVQNYTLDSPLDPTTNKPNTQELTHLPYPIILLRVLSIWLKQNDGHYPADKPGLNGKEKQKEKNDFRKLLQTERENVIKKAREGDSEVDLDLENWDEANDAVGKFVFGDRAEGKVTGDLKEWFKDPECEVTKESSNFWLLVNGLRSFSQVSPESDPPGSSGLLPLTGSLPDFKSLSQTYITLTKIYRSKAAEDISNFKRHLSNTLSSINLPETLISDDEIESFCKNAGYLKLIRGRSLQDSKAKPQVDVVKSGFWGVLDPPGPVIQHHLAFLVADQFFKNEGRWPGASKSFTDLILGIDSNNATENGDVEMKDEIELEKDNEKMVALAKEVLEKFELDEEMWEKVEDSIKEMVRSAHSDLPSTSALLGGVAAQESIKIITKQYIPLDNTAIYDGIKGSIGAFAL